MSSLERQLVSEREDTFTKMYLGQTCGSLKKANLAPCSEIASTENIVKKLPDLISELNMVNLSLMLVAETGTGSKKLILVLII